MRYVSKSAACLQEMMAFVIVALQLLADARQTLHRLLDGHRNNGAL